VCVCVCVCVCARVCQHAAQYVGLVNVVLCQGMEASEYRQGRSEFSVEINWMLMVHTPCTSTHIGFVMMMLNVDHMMSVT
jgi:hypothetical protein